MIKNAVKQSRDRQIVTTPDEVVTVYRVQALDLATLALVDQPIMRTREYAAAWKLSVVEGTGITISRNALVDESARPSASGRRSLKPPML